MSHTFVLVHGSNCNSFSWAPMQRELALLGHRSLAVDLPGHGFAAGWHPSYQAPQDPAALASAASGQAGRTVAECVEHVVEVVRRAAAHGPVTLVGHSRGGLTLTGVGNAVPELLDRLVYVSAWCCVDSTVAGYVASPENADSVLGEAAGVMVGDIAALGAIRMNWRTADAGLLATLKTAMLAEGTDEEFLAFLNTMEPDESLDAGGTGVQADAATWGRVPRSYIRLTRDRSLPVALQDRFIAEADALTPANPFDVHSVEGSHVGFLVHPREVAGILAKLAA
ncbi:alpha/beta hydrolase [Saccharopolyspora erythraea]|uniref:alpha/beta fold hydrolase n=1 Tax=Saccharopolyspora erythraea TaxID=1836 RepID=UPI001BA47C3E|nr:alpha/beta hydrolase [Saccharopolyspora erythraea]QUG99708.1 alpha/beta hydrolase [Saccharopolyspora erythraea]